MSPHRSVAPFTAPLVMLLAVALAVVPIGCQAPTLISDSADGTGDGMSAGEDADGSAWSSAFRPPAYLDTDRVHLEPLTPEHAAQDHAAFMSSREHLHRTLHWGSWPREDTTVEENRTDLERHAREFEERTAYAYTVLEPDRSACVGCIYINPVEGDPDAARLGYWVVEKGVWANLDEHLLRVVLNWILRDWPFERVTIDLHVENARGIAVAEELRLTRTESSRENHVTFEWRRPRY